MLRCVALMEAASTFETSVYFYQTTQCNIPEDNHLHIRRRESLKSHPLHNFNYMYMNVEKLQFYS
jgi:hypothetical protein